MHEFFDDIVPHPEGVDPDSELIHERAYVVRAYRKDAGTLVMRGAVRDQKPPGLYVPDDPDPLTMHHMILDLHLAVPQLVITHAAAAFQVHPHTLCPDIEPRYEQLVGLSIARGFTHKVRELFGGPRGCTHITALLQAMAPVAVQSLWSFRALNSRDSRAPDVEDGSARATATADARKMALLTNLNTCHVWAEDGEQVATLHNGGEVEMPLWVTKRYRELGLAADTWPMR